MCFFQPSMELTRLYLRLCLCVVLWVHSVNALIGLRPAKQDPNYKEDDSDKRHIPVSPKPEQIHRTQLHTPYDSIGYSHDFSVNETDLADKFNQRQQCQTVQLLQCSQRLLKHALYNDTNVCSYTQDFTHCILNNLRKYGRRNFVIGMTALGDLNAGVKESFRCHGNTSEPDKAHTRHLISKRHGDTCCTEKLLQCAIQTFFKTVYNFTQRCSLVNFYDVCLNDDVTLTCGITIDKVYVTDLRTSCRGKKRRRR